MIIKPAWWGPVGIPVVGTYKPESPFLSWKLGLEPDFPLPHMEMHPGGITSVKITPTTKNILHSTSTELQRESFQVFIPVL